MHKKALCNGQFGLACVCGQLFTQPFSNSKMNTCVPILLIQLSEKPPNRTRKIATASIKKTHSQCQRGVETPTPASRSQQEYFFASSLEK
ncbi:hypothetical protein [Parasphingorhabdus sp.]|uniref:hypothetical protein n=1 Tax=Parasphingorhabdus sp. TaxID=2709688 RepID=UPI00329905B1